MYVPNNTYFYPRGADRPVLIESWERTWKAHYLDASGKRRKVTITAAPDETRAEIDQHLAECAESPERKGWRLLGVVEGKLLPV